MSRKQYPNPDQELQSVVKAQQQIEYTEQDKAFLQTAPKLATVAKTAIKTLVDQFTVLNTQLGADLEPKICHLLHPAMTTVYNLDEVGKALADAASCMAYREEQDRLAKDKESEQSCFCFSTL